MAHLFANDTIKPSKGLRNGIRFSLISIDRIRGRLIRNPGYGGPSVGPYSWTWRPEISKDQSKAQFKAALRDSVANEGIRNPILVWAFPEGIFLTFGGSRVGACKDVGIDRIPAIINDYTGEFADCPEVTPENFTEFFTDPPRSYEFTKEGFDYHYNLERARRANHDPNGFAWVDGTPTFIKAEFPWLIED